MPSFLGAKVNTDVGHVSLPAFNLLAIAERGRIMRARADSTALSDRIVVDLFNLARNRADIVDLVHLVYENKVV